MSLGGDIFIAASVTKLAVCVEMFTGPWLPFGVLFLGGSQKELTLSPFMLSQDTYFIET